MMEDIYDQAFSHQKFGNTKLKKGTYESCRFEDCDFQDLHLSQYTFIDSEFQDCDFSNIRWKESQFQDCLFTRCKLIGLRFEELSRFGLALELRDCRVDYSSMFGFAPARFKMTGGSAVEVDFSQAQLQSSTFEAVDFANAQFDHTNLSQAQMIDCLNLVLNPAENQVKGMSVSKRSLPGLLIPYGLKILE